MSNLLLSILTTAATVAKGKFLYKTRHSAATQERFLLSLLQAYQGTELGKKYHFTDIKTIEQFRERLPILPYSSYEPYLERIARGEPNILTSDPVVFINLTSGSTGKKKLIPVTKRSRQIRGRVNQISIGFAVEAAQRRGVPLGNMLLTSSVQLLGYTSAGIPYGPVSVGDLRLSNILYKQIFAHPYEALQPEDSLARHYICLLFALQNRNLRIIGANFPILGLGLCQYLERYGQDLVRDLETGKIASWLDIKPQLRVNLENLLSAVPKRATQLGSILKSEGRLTPILAWPNLSFVVTARGGTSDFYFQRFPEYFGSTPIFGGIYSSAETIFGVCHEFDNDGAILSIDSGFFEFIPVEQWEVEQPKTLLANEVKVGECYRILVTNYSGIYRYDIGDVVEVVGFYEQTPIIVFRHRRGGLLSSTTEKTTEFHVIGVMQRLQQEFNLSLENFCITLSDKEVPPHYLVNIELLPGNSIQNPQEFLARFDLILKEIHVSYEVKRRNQVPPPRLRILKSGSFATLREDLLKRGIPASQLKFPHISDNRQLFAKMVIEQEFRLLEDERKDN